MTLALPLLLGGCASTTQPADGLEQGLLAQDLTVVPWNHAELHLQAGGPPLPLVLGDEPTFGFCVEAPGEIDTSQWQASVSFDPSEDTDYLDPTLRWGPHLCFDGPVPPALPDGAARLCPRIRDAFDGRDASLPCIGFERRREDPSRLKLSQEMGSILELRSELTPQVFVERLNALADRALTEGYPSLHLRLRLISTYYLRQIGTLDSTRRALRQLTEIPDWLDSPAATLWSAMVHYESGSLQMEPGQSMERAWAELERSRDLYQRVLDIRRFTPAMKQAEILSRAGSAEEAIRRLGDALGSCETVPCDPRLEPSARNTYGWLLLQDSDASSETLREAVELFRNTIDERSEEPPDVELANYQINLGYALLRNGEDPRAALNLAREALRSAEPADTTRSRWLSSWADWIEARHELESGHPGVALNLCSRLAEQPIRSRLRAWSYSCVADAHRKLGELDRASVAIARALAHHEAGVEAGLGQDLFLGPGQRADDFYRAARIELERGDAAAAWETLDRLDRNFAPRRTSEECRSLIDSGERRRTELLNRLDALEIPAAGARKAQREVIRLRLLEQLQEIVRMESTCVGIPDDLGSHARFRAVPLADEVLLLGREPGGKASLYRRTPIARRDLVAAVEVVRRQMRSGEECRESWREALSLLGRALVPEDRDLEPVTSFTLHGILQAVPLDVLPLRGSPESPLVSRTAIALLSAGSPGRGSRNAVEESTGLGRALFVIDPTGNLRAEAGDLVDRVRFSEASWLEGAEATTEAVRAAMRDASFLHMDTHAQYEPAFPELSTIRLHDGGLDASAFRSGSNNLRGANLSACRSGSWPATADSGRYGLAGVLARAEVPWVIGARTDLDDRFAKDFNRDFYTRLAAGQTVPEAFRRALDATREGYPEPVWAALFLLSGS